MELDPHVICNIVGVPPKPLGENTLRKIRQLEIMEQRKTLSQGSRDITKFSSLPTHFISYLVLK